MIQEPKVRDISFFRSFINDILFIYVLVWHNMLLGVRMNPYVTFAIGKDSQGEGVMALSPFCLLKWMYQHTLGTDLRIKCAQNLYGSMDICISWVNSSLWFSLSVVDMHLLPR